MPMRSALDRFPILLDSDTRRKHPHWPVSIPWDLIAPHETQAVKNHAQSLRRLAERGGLSPAEMYVVITDQNLRRVYGIG